MPKSVASSSSSNAGDYEPRTVPEEVRLGTKDHEFYDKYRLETDLREPYRIPKAFLKDTNVVEAPDLPEIPTIVFINSRSGGRAGPALATGLRQALGHSQVFDLSVCRPDKVLKQIWANFEEEAGHDNGETPMIQQRLRILAAGGDGTVAWVLQSIKRLNLEPQPPVGILPLGTGNDLSRSFKWGATFNKAWVKNFSSIYKTLKRVADSEVMDLDCWNVELIAPGADYFKRALPHAFVDGTPIPGKEVKAAMSWNYISVGLDAQSAYGFHHLRETRPGLAFSRAANQFWYAVYGCKSGWFCCSKPVRNRVKVFVDDGAGGWKEVPVPRATKAVVVCNLQSYAGGSNLWGKHTAADEKKGWKGPGVADGLVEVVGLNSGYHTGMVLSGAIHAVRIAQTNRVRLAFCAGGDTGKSRSKVYVQLDGEPWKQDVPAGTNVEPLCMDITSAGKSRVLYNSTALPGLMPAMVPLNAAGKPVAKKVPVTPAKPGPEPKQKPEDANATTSGADAALPTTAAAGAAVLSATDAVPPTEVVPAMDAVPGAEVEMATAQPVEPRDTGDANGAQITAAEGDLAAASARKLVR